MEKEYCISWVNLYPENTELVFDPFKRYLIIGNNLFENFGFHNEIQLKDFWKEKIDRKYGTNYFIMLVPDKTDFHKAQIYLKALDRNSYCGYNLIVGNVYKFDFKIYNTICIPLSNRNIVN